MSSTSKKWIAVAVAALAIAAIAGGAAGLLAGESEQRGAANPDRAASARPGLPTGYEARNTVSAPAAAPAAGWIGEAQLATEDTWEPSIAADPGQPYVYAMYNRYGPSCGRSCPNPAMFLRISADGGATWAAERLICTCKTQGQYDPVLATTSAGAVYGTWMNYNQIVFSKSPRGGASWTTPIVISGRSWADKPWIGTSADGVDVYIGYESRSVLYLTASHDSGATWSIPVAVNSDSSVYRYPNGFAVLPNGTAVLAASKYPGGSKQATGSVDIDIWRTVDGGTSWSRVVVDTVFTGVDYNTSSTTTIAGDAGGTLVLEYSGAVTSGTNGRLFVRRSTDGGVTWSVRTELGDASANASFPAITSRGTGDFRLTWMDNRGGGWNVYYRASSDGGLTWPAASLDISEATTGPSYKSAAGFGSPYGDYDAIAITSFGKAISVSGQGASFSGGPGGIWVNRQS